jgi:prepilin-type N-terminal cleavage/methylation domain-containing protein/prepilin-type processing-associated H-X9-DG protein
MRFRGFTLVELLVVVAIISLLLGILVPALGRARELARRVTCLSNTRQMALAATTYAQEYGQRFPIASYWADDNGRFVEGFGPMWVCWDTITYDGEARAGLIWQYAGDGEQAVQQCPSFEGDSRTPADEYTGYNYNTSYIGKGYFEPSTETPSWMPARVHDIRRPSETALFGDAQNKASNKFMRAPFGYGRFGDAGGASASIPREAGTQGFRHLGTTSVSWVDGHASSMDTIHLQSSVTNPDRLAGVGEGNGWLGPDDTLYDLE